MIQFANDRFREEHDVTIGVEYATKVVSMADTKIKLQVWDTVPLPSSLLRLAPKPSNP